MYLGFFSVQDKVGFTYINTGDLNYLAAYTTVKFDKKITDIQLLFNANSNFSAISCREQVNFQCGEDEVRFIQCQHT
jgi:exonuclease I